MTKNNGRIARNRWRGATVTTMVGLCAALTASSASAESSPFVGRWHWNRAQSTLPPGEPFRVASDTTASTRVTGDTLQATFRGPGGYSDAQTCAVAANRKQMTCQGVLTDGDGQTTTYVDVYDRM